MCVCVCLYNLIPVIVTKSDQIFPIDFNLENTILPLITKDKHSVRVFVLCLVLKDDISENTKIQ